MNHLEGFDLDLESDLHFGNNGFLQSLTQEMIEVTEELEAKNFQNQGMAEENYPIDIFFQNESSLQNYPAIDQFQQVDQAMGEGEEIQNPINEPNGQRVEYLKKVELLPNSGEKKTRRKTDKKKKTTYDPETGNRTTGFSWKHSVKAIREAYKELTGVKKSPAEEYFSSKFYQFASLLLVEEWCSGDQARLERAAKVFEKKIVKITGQLDHNNQNELYKEEMRSIELAEKSFQLYFEGSVKEAIVTFYDQPKQLDKIEEYGPYKRYLELRSKRGLAD